MSHSIERSKKVAQKPNEIKEVDFNPVVEKITSIYKEQLALLPEERKQKCTYSHPIQFRFSFSKELSKKSLKMAAEQLSILCSCHVDYGSKNKIHDLRLFFDNTKGERHVASRDCDNHFDSKICISQHGYDDQIVPYDL